MRKLRLCSLAMVKKDAGEDCGSPRNSHGQAVGDGLVLAMHFGLADVDSGCGSSISLLVAEGSHWWWCGLVHGDCWLSCLSSLLFLFGFTVVLGCLSDSGNFLNW